MCSLKKDNWGARKYLWANTDGNDEFEVKVAPRLEPKEKKMPEPVMDVPYV